MNLSKYLSILIVSTAAWQVLHFVAQRLMNAALDSATGRKIVRDEKSRESLRVAGPSYLVSTVHAIIVCSRGSQHLLNLFRASIPLKLHDPTRFPISITGFKPLPYQFRYLLEIRRVTHTNLLLCSYLLSDLHLVVNRFPKLGSYDTVLHHVAFLVCSIIAGYYHLHPFMFAWLILGELSTPFLNLRWFLIKCGYGHTLLLVIVQFVFALLFFISRIALYSLGLTYHIEIITRMPQYVPTWATYTTFSATVVGFFLNIAWFVNIIRILRRPRRRKPKQTEESEASAPSNPIKKD